MNVRRAMSADHTALTSLFERFYAEEGFAHALVGIAGNLRQILGREDTAAFIAEEEGRILGGALLSVSFGLEAGLYCELEDIYVLPGHRRRGIATALMDAAAEWASVQGCRDMEVVLTPAAQAGPLPGWYTARGFADTGRRILERSL